jgi:LPXTG-motif cell wall-anchored protein
MKRVAAALAAALALAVPLGLAPAASAATVPAGDGLDHKTVTLQVGDTLVVTLASTAWTIDAASGGALRAQGAQVVAVSRPGPGAPGTTSRTFAAVVPGSARITASRVNCGEALRCNAEQAGYVLTVRVAAAPVQLPHTGLATRDTLTLGLGLLLVGATGVALGTRRTT